MIEDELNKHLPFVSIIMPIYNEVAFIERSLGAVLAQDYPQELTEILIVEGGSYDGTKDLIQRIIHESSKRIHVLSNPKRIQAIGLNIALRRVRGEVIIRVDGHTEIAPDYIRQCVTALQCDGIDNVGGTYMSAPERQSQGKTTVRYISTSNSGIVGQAVAAATSTFFGNGGACYRYPHISHVKLVDSVPLGAWRREVFKRIGLFREDFPVNEDEEFNYRLLAAGGQIILSPKIKSKYHTRNSIKALWCQYFRYGYMKVRVMQLHPRRMCLRQFLPAIFVSIVSILCLLSLFSNIGKIFLFLVTGSYIMTNLISSLWCAYKNKWYYLFVLPLVFTTLHLGYGIGFLLGMARFLPHWNNQESPPRWD